MTTQEKIKRITAICNRVGCDDKSKRLHLHVYVEDGWIPHASQPFKAWLSRHRDPDVRKLNPVTAYNCKSFVDEYMEAKQIGAA
jgi:hypothetical protein